MRKAILCLAVAAFIACPVMSWASALPDDVVRDSLQGNAVTLEAGLRGLPGGPAQDPVGTHEVFYCVQGQDGVIYYTIRDLCPDNVAACDNPATGQGLSQLGFGVLLGQEQADFGGEFFAASNGFANAIAAAGIAVNPFGPGTNGDPVLSAMGDANQDGWPGPAGMTPWLPIPTGAPGDNDPDISYMSSTVPFFGVGGVNNVNNQGSVLASFRTDPLRTNRLISPFDIVIDVRGMDGAMYRTAYNLNAVLVPPAIINSNAPTLSPGTGAAMDYIDRAFLQDVTGACNIGDGWPGCASRFTPDGVLINDSGQEQTPWVVVSN